MLGQLDELLLGVVASADSTQTCRPWHIEPLNLLMLSIAVWPHRVRGRALVQLAGVVAAVVRMRDQVLGSRCLSTLLSRHCAREGASTAAVATCCSIRKE